MQSIQNFNNPGIKYVFTDIDDTLTTDGKLPFNSYKSLWDLSEAGITVVPVTGRPAGWCEMIARLWPVHGVIGENGAFYFSYQNQQMKREFFVPEEQLQHSQSQLEAIKKQVLTDVPGSAVASDQFCRLADLAIDFCEDVPALPKKQVDKIVEIFKTHGAQAKISSIHVNGWFGDFNKLKMCQRYCLNEFGFSLDENLSKCAFIGDSPNDEPMWEFFTNGFAVANIKSFVGELNSKPTFVTNNNGANGFEEFASNLL